MKITQDLLFLTRHDIEQYFSNNMAEAFNEVKKTYLEFSSGLALNPPSSFLWYDENNKSRIIALPAFINGENKSQKSLGIKWISSCPTNIDHHLPRASGLIVINDYDTGFPMAVLEGALISALRTALSALISVEYLHNNKCMGRLGIIGCGTIAETFLRCMRTLDWSTDQVFLYDLKDKRSELFARTNCSDAKICTSVNELTFNSNIILLTTTVLSPYIFQSKKFLKNSTILNLSLRDLGENIILDAFNIVDDIENVLHANTSPHLAFLASGNKDFIHGTLADLINKKVKVSNEKIKIFSPMGLGILDIALANLVYQNYAQDSRGKCIEHFF